ncbi:MAG: ion transporter [Arenicella sp.]|nr:ion transporter [Arenicella sp.]
MSFIKQLVESNWFQTFIIVVIVLNGIILGLETNDGWSAPVHSALKIIDGLCLFIFVVELVLKLMVYRLSFFTKGWNIFDFVIVVISLIPSSGGLSILRAFRILRVLRLITAVDSFRRVVSGMLLAIPGVGSVAGLLLLVFYISGVLSTMLFGATFPQWFGSLGDSMYSLFQIMTLESWSMGIVRPIMVVHPYAWAFFIPFITVTTFTVLNLFIGIVVDAMATVKEAEAKELQQDNGEIEIETMIMNLQKEVRALRDDLNTPSLSKPK